MSSINLDDDSLRNWSDFSLDLKSITVGRSLRRWADIVKTADADQCNMFGMDQISVNIMLTQEQYQLLLKIEEAIRVEAEHYGLEGLIK